MRLGYIVLVLMYLSSFGQCILQKLFEPHIDYKLDDNTTTYTGLLVSNEDTDHGLDLSIDDQEKQQTTEQDDSEEINGGINNNLSGESVNIISKNSKRSRRNFHNVNKSRNYMNELKDLLSQSDDSDDDVVEKQHSEEINEGKNYDSRATSANTIFKYKKRGLFYSIIKAIKYLDDIEDLFYDSDDDLFRKRKRGRSFFLNFNRIRKYLYEVLDQVSGDSGEDFVEEDEEDEEDNEEINEGTNDVSIEGIPNTMSKKRKPGGKNSYYVNKMKDALNDQEELLSQSGNSAEYYAVQPKLTAEIDTRKNERNGRIRRNNLNRKNEKKRDQRHNGNGMESEISDHENFEDKEVEPKSTAHIGSQQIELEKQNPNNNVNISPGSIKIEDEVTLQDAGTINITPTPIVPKLGKTQKKHLQNHQLPLTNTNINRITSGNGVTTFISESKSNNTKSHQESSSSSSKTVRTISK